MPGGQYTNLREQARGLGLADRWPEVAHAYADVNDVFGDIVKVTPTSKVVGDMAMMMVTSGIDREALVDPTRDIAFPESVVSMFRGELGQPFGGFPKELQNKVLKGAAPLPGRPGAVLPPVDLAAARAEAEQKAGRKLTDQQFDSYLMYPKVFLDWNAHRGKFGDVSVLPTSVFFYGMSPGQEVTVEGDPGKTEIIRFVAVSEPHADATRTVFYEVNGAPRSVTVADRALKPDRTPAVRADPGNPDHVAAPMPGMVSTVASRPATKWSAATCC